MARSRERKSERVVLAAMTTARRALGVGEIAKAVGKSEQAVRQILYLLRNAGCAESDARATCSKAFLRMERKWKPTGKPLAGPEPKAAPPANERSPSRFDHRALAAALGMDTAPADARDAHIRALLGIH